MRKFILLCLLVFLAGCSTKDSKLDVLSKISSFNRERIQNKEKADSTNYKDYLKKTDEIIAKIEELPSVSDWPQGDSLKTFMVKGSKGDKAYFESLGRKKSGSMDEKFVEMSQLSSNLEYDINIMRILINEKSKIDKMDKE